MNLPTKFFLFFWGALLSQGSLATGAIESYSRVKQFLDPSGDTSVVMIDGGTDQGMVAGAVLLAYRQRPDATAGGEFDESRQLVMTGKLKAIKVAANYTLAKITENSSIEAKAFFPKFSQVMAGDLIREKAYDIAKVQDITPTSEITYMDLFVDPKPNPDSYEISDHGRMKLTELAAAYSFAKVGQLIVEGHTDQNGPSEINQVESYQRALTIRQFLISQLGFDKKRVVAIGFGEAEPKITGFPPGYREANRRIILKTIPH